MDNVRTLEMCAHQIDFVSRAKTVDKRRMGLPFPMQNFLGLFQVICVDFWDIDDLGMFLKAGNPG